jgi:sulfur-oxidizing protein SoxA
MIWRIFLALSLIWPVVAYAADIPADQRISAYQTMSAETRAMQDDDAANPATLWVLDGEALWKAPAGQEQKSCADCHGDAHEKMKGVAARYPRFDETRGKPVDIEQQINICRTERQNATPLAWESHDLLALTAYVARQSRGEKISIAPDARAQSSLDSGKRLFTARRGQLDLSCAQCHDDNWGKSLAGANIPQGQATGYPLYRLEWQSLGSLRRRLRNCLSGMRAELWPQDAPEYVDLELYLMSRANGMTMESAAVRP